MKNNKRIFVVAWEYPPIMSGESVVCKRTLEHSKFDYDVCCGPIDDIGDKHIRLFGFKGNKYLIWPFQVLNCFKKLNKESNYQIMMSRVMPPNGHLVGWLIKRICPHIKWVVYFSDPIWNSPFIKLSIIKNQDHRPNWFLMKLLGIPSKLAIKECDLLVFNNERLARFVLGKRYELYKSKIVIAPYGHEGIKIRSLHNHKDGKIHITHVGQIYGNRTLEALSAGVLLLKQKKPDLYHRIIIRQIGFISKCEIERVKNLNIDEIFEFCDAVSYERSIEEMYQADYLLEIDPVFDEQKKNIYVAGKLFDYISTGRPILCIAEKDSATGDLMPEENVIKPNAESVFNALIRVITGSIANSEKIDFQMLNCQYGVGIFDRAIDRLLMEGLHE